MQSALPVGGARRAGVQPLPVADARCRPLPCLRSVMDRRLCQIKNLVFCYKSRSSHRLCNSLTISGVAKCAVLASEMGRFRRRNVPFRVAKRQVLIFDTFCDRSRFAAGAVLRSCLDFIKAVFYPCHLECLFEAYLSICFVTQPAMLPQQMDKYASKTHLKPAVDKIKTASKPHNNRTCTHIRHTIAMTAQA